jgi:Ni,Fe-hydrogenase III large subunit
MTSAKVLPMRNSEAADLVRIPVLSIGEFRDTVLRLIKNGARLAAYFGQPSEDKAVTLYAVLADGAEGILSVLSTQVAEQFPALTPDCPQADRFEREIAEQWNLKPEGHPWLKPLRFHAPYRARREGGEHLTQSSVAVMDFFQVSGESIHEVAVGPVHAGIIEPGHFRFQCHGEDVLHLEISLGYQHRGVERALVGGPNKRTIHYMETLAGDTTIGHATAYVQALEALASTRVPARAEILRAIALELERIANHVGGLGALAGDVGYLPTLSYCGRLRGDFLNMTARLCGSRFGRGFIRPGGVVFDVDPDRIRALLEALRDASIDVKNAVELLWNTPSVLARFEGTGRLAPQVALDLGLVGPAARACGLERDARFDFPSGYFRFAQIPISVWHTGDVFSRAYLRWLEIQRSLSFVRERLNALPEGPVRSTTDGLAPNRLVVSLVEGWRGEICHVAITDAQGGFSRYKVVDPSFHNWKALEMALRGGQISDFPLINKSFDLSYAGHDL